MADWGWVQVDINDKASLDRWVLQSEVVFATRGEALAHLQRFLDKASGLKAPCAIGARQLREGRMRDGTTVGGMGTYWVLGQAPAETRLFLVDREGLARAVVVRIEPAARVNARTGPADPARGAVTGRINPRDIPVRLRIEGFVIGLCYALGVLFTIGGVRSWLDASRWEMGRILFVPAVAALVGAYYRGRNFRARAFAYLNR